MSPGWCIVSDFIFNTDFIRSACDNVQTFKYADDMTILGLLNFKDSDILQNYFDSIKVFSNVLLSILPLT